MDAAKDNAKMRFDSQIVVPFTNLKDMWCRFFYVFCLRHFNPLALEMDI